MRNKKIMVLLILSFLFFLVLGSMYSYSLYESRNEQAIEMKVANWNIFVNESLVTGEEELSRVFTINDMVLSGGGTTVKEGLFAPGVSGSFTLAIDPSDTEVSFDYFLTVDGSKIENDMIKIVEVQQIDKTGNPVSGGALTPVENQDGVYQGFFKYDEARKNQNADDRSVIVRITITWFNDEDNNEEDTKVGISSNTPKLDIPVKVSFKQHVGS